MYLSILYFFYDSIYNVFKTVPIPFDTKSIRCLQEKHTTVTRSMHRGENFYEAGCKTLGHYVKKLFGLSTTIKYDN